MRHVQYLAAADEAAALRALGEPHANAIAGGTGLVDLMKIHIQNPALLVDVNALPMAAITPIAGGLSLGANAKNTAVAQHDEVKKRFPVLSEALLAGASPQLRNMASVGGNVMQRTRCSYFRDITQPCNKRVPGSGCGALTGFQRMHAVLGTSDKCIAAHPSDMCVALVALDATVVVRGPKGERRVPFGEFHLEPGQHPEREHALRDGELITAVEVHDAPYAARSRYVKVRDRSSYAFALASAAVALELDGETIKSARVALGGVGTRPWRSREAEAALVGKKATEPTFKAAADAALKGAKPLKGNAFKVELAKRTVAQALALTAGII